MRPHFAVSLANRKDAVAQTTGAAKVTSGSDGDVGLPNRTVWVGRGCKRVPPCPAW